MGVVGAPDERTVLLSGPQQQTFASKQTEFAAQPPPEAARDWDGNLFQCCGRRCTSAGWFSCAFASLLPCVAFGDNMKRAFRASFWVHALVFFILFYGVHRTFDVAVHFTADSCKPVVPAKPEPLRPRPAVEAGAHDAWLSGRKLLQIDDGPSKFAEAFADVLPSATAHAVVHGGSAEQAEPEARPANIRKSAASAEIDPMPVELTEVRDEPAFLDCIEGPDAGPKACHHRHHTEPVPHPPQLFYLPFSPEFAQATPGCQKAYMGLFVLHHIAIAAVLAGVVYAARQRTLMRERFAIPGSKCGDFFAWFCCSPCALCQESRTVRANNVFDGQWDNASQPRQVVSAADWAQPTLVKPPKVVEV